MKLKNIGILCIVSMLLVGCGTSDDVSIGQSKVNYLNTVKEYDKNLKEIVKVEENIINYIVGEEDELNIENFIGSNTSKISISNEINKAREYVKEVINSDRVMLEELHTDVKGGELENILVRDSDYFINNMKSYYFLNKDNGLIEHYIVIYDGGTLIKLSLNWVGGVIADAKVSRYN